MELGLVRNWWMLALRGVVAIAFGVLVFFWPGFVWAVIVGLFAGFALLDGVLAIAIAVTGHSRDGKWWALVFEGLVGIAAAMLALTWPAVTEVVLLYLFGFWAVLTGILEIAAAVRLREEIEGEWTLGLAGALSLVFGSAILLVPAAGAARSRLVDCRLRHHLRCGDAGALGIRLQRGWRLSKTEPGPAI